MMYIAVRTSLPVDPLLGVLVVLDQGGTRVGQPRGQTQIMHQPGARQHQVRFRLPAQPNRRTSDATYIYSDQQPRSSDPGLSLPWSPM